MPIVRLEPTYSSYTKVTDVNNTGKGQNGITGLYVDEANQKAYVADGDLTPPDSPSGYQINFDGTGWAKTSARVGLSGSLAQQRTLFGRYMVVIDESGTGLDKIFRDGALLQSIDISAFDFGSGAMVNAITPLGSYLVIAGRLGADSTKVKVQVWQGVLSGL